MYKPKEVLSQNDDRWASILLGFNTDTYTIGSHGCLITCLAMIADTTPDIVNQKLKAIKGFSSGGYYNWGAFTTAFGIKESPFITPATLKDVQVNEIKNALDKGYPVMCGIDSNPADADYDMHFVLLLDYEGEEFTIADPWNGTIRPLKDYLYGTKPTFRNTVEQYIIYEVADNPVENVENCEESYQELADYLCELLELDSSLYDNRKMMTAVGELYKDFQTSKTVIDSQNKTFEQEKLVWTATKEAMIADTDNLLEELEITNKKLVEATSGSGWHFIALGLEKLLKRGEI